MSPNIDTAGSESSKGALFAFTRVLLCTYAASRMRFEGRTGVTSDEGGEVAKPF